MHHPLVHNKSLVDNNKPTSLTIEEYMAELYMHNEQVDLEIDKIEENVKLFDASEIGDIIRNLGNKAKGLDNLSSAHIKLVMESKKHKALVVSKITSSINSWLLGAPIPSYLTLSKTIPLSKEDSCFPSYGAIRTISILPAISKILEKAILGRLKSHLRMNNGLN